jgi:ribosomal protein S18 acetylase RimI-like enzyme
MSDTLAHSAARAEALLRYKAERDFAEAAATVSGAAAQRFGTVLATRVSELPDHLGYNKARPFRAGDLGRLGEVLAFYRDHGLRPAVEVGAGDAAPDLHRRLIDAGLVPVAPTAVLHARPRCLPAPAGIEVREAEEDDPYLETLYRGYGVAEGETAFRAMLAAEHRTPGLRRYLAFIDDCPAAAAALFGHGGTAYLAGAATDPAFRRRGCQTALVAKRLGDLGSECDLAVVTVAFGSPSHENLARLGFQIAHTRTVWR